MAFALTLFTSASHFQKRSLTGLRAVHTIATYPSTKALKLFNSNSCSLSLSHFGKCVKRRGCINIASSTSSFFNHKKEFYYQDIPSWHSKGLHTSIFSTRTELGALQVTTSVFGTEVKQRPFTMGGKKRFGGKRKVGWWEKRKNKKECSEGDDNGEKLANEGKYRKDARKDREETSPHPGSFATLEMRQQFGYPEILEETFPGANKEKEASSSSSQKKEQEDSSHKKEGPTSIENSQNDTETTTTKRNETVASATAAEEESSKAPKRKLAFLVGFLGDNYAGFQINKGQRTLQAEIEYAMFKAGLLEQSNFGYPVKHGWTTSARTDKGVHACALVCGAKVRMDCSLDDVRERLNTCLPNDIRVLDAKRVPRSFNAKNARNKVRYQYMVPSFLLQDRTTLQQILYEQAPRIQSDGKEREWRKKALSVTEASTIYNKFKSFRSTEEQRNALSDALRAYEGTHCYHNYTKKKSFHDSSSSRFIMKFYTSDPVISSIDGMEWIPTHVVGQSFLLNQIRKMISMAVDVARGAATADSMTKSFEDRLMRVNIAPAQGLFLEMSYYDFFNNRQNPNQNADELDWSSDNADSKAVARWRQFKEEQIMPRIMQEEGKEYNFINYIYIHESKFNFRKYHKFQEAGQHGDDADDDDGVDDILDEPSDTEHLSNDEDELEEK